MRMYPEALAVLFPPGKCIVQGSWDTWTAGLTFVWIASWGQEPPPHHRSRHHHRRRRPHCTLHRHHRRPLPLPHLRQQLHSL